ISMLVAVLITYALLARRSEAVAWWAAGQSVYRMALPCLLCAVLVSGGVWLCQEHILPEANRRQEMLRAQIRGGAAQVVTSIGQHWLALPSSSNIFTYSYNSRTETLETPTVFEFDDENVHVRRIITGGQGVWLGPDKLEFEQARVFELPRPSAGWRKVGTLQLTAPMPHDLFKPLLSKPLELNTNALSAYIKTLKLQRGVDVRSFEVALAERWVPPLAPLVMALLGLPLALAVGRRTALAALSAAVAVGLAFWGSVSGFQQLSQHQLLPPPVAAWGPLLLFSAVGAYLLSRARTYVESYFLDWPRKQPVLYVPVSQLDRYSSCSDVSVSMLSPSERSFSPAISVSTASGSICTPGLSWPLRLTRYSTDKAWFAKLISMTLAGCPSAAAKLIRRPSPSTMMRACVCLRLYSSTN